MIYIDARIDDGDSDTFTLGNGVSSLNVCASADPLIIDRGRLEMPLLRENGAPT
jgi:hypothetical protein